MCLSGYCSSISEERRAELLALRQVIADSPGISVGELAALLELSDGTVRGMLMTMCTMGALVSESYNNRLYIYPPPDD